MGKTAVNDIQKSRIVMIGHKEIPSRSGGVEIVVERLSTGLVADGYDVTVYNRGGSSDGHRNEYQGVHLVTIPAPSGSGLNAFVYACLATIRATFSKFDIYHFHAEGPCVMLWLPNLCRKRIIVTVHGLDWQRAKWGRIASRVILRGEKQAVKHADEIIVLSRNVQEYFKKTYGRDTVYIPNGVDKPTPVSPGAVSDRYGLTPGGYLLCVARIVPEKGLHYLIRAYKDVQTDMKLVIAGGSGQADDYMRDIEAMVAGDDRIILTGFVDGEELSELYSNAYLYVCPSDVEGMSLSLLEAASYGNCCLVSDIPENTEVLGDHCIAFKAGDVDALSAQIRRLIADSDIPKHIQNGVADYIYDKYNWGAMIRGTEKVYSN